jgi:transposase-like protein
MRVEVLGGLERRRRWSLDDKARIVEETLAPGAKVTAVARHNGVAASLVFTWRRQARTSEQVVPSFAPVQIAATGNQRRELEAVAERSGWEIVRIYEDAGISGAEGRDKRPGLDAMMKAVNAKEFDMVATWSADRLGKSLTDLFSTLQGLRDKGVVSSFTNRVSTRRQAVDRACVVSRNQISIGTGNISAQQMPIARVRHPFGPSQMALMREVGSRKVCLRIDVQHDLRHFAPVCSLGVSVQKAGIHDSVLDVVLRHLSIGGSRISNVGVERRVSYRHPSASDVQEFPSILGGTREHVQNGNARAPLKPGRRSKTLFAVASGMSATAVAERSGSDRGPVYPRFCCKSRFGLRFKNFAG